MIPFIVRFNQIYLKTTHAYGYKIAAIVKLEKLGANVRCDGNKVSFTSYTLTPPGGTFNPLMGISSGSLEITEADGMIVNVRYKFFSGIALAIVTFPFGLLSILEVLSQKQRPEYLDNIKACLLVLVVHHVVSIFRFRNMLVDIASEGR